MSNQSEHQSTGLLPGLMAGKGGRKFVQHDHLKHFKAVNLFMKGVIILEGAHSRRALNYFVVHYEFQRFLTFGLKCFQTIVV